MRSQRLIRLLGVFLALSACGSRTDTTQSLSSPGVSESADVLSSTPPTPPAPPPQALTGSIDESLLQAPAGSLLDAVLLGGRTFSDIEDDVQTRLAACMTKAGWTYQPVISGDAERAADPTLPLAQVIDLRRKVGYGITLPPNEKGDANFAYLQSLSADDQSAFLAALGDSGSGGCVDLAEREGHAGIPFYDPAYSALTSEFSAALAASTAMENAWGEWTTCMAAHGIIATSQLDLQTTVRSKIDLPADEYRGQYPALVADEVRTASADVDCYAAHVQPIKIKVQQAVLDEWRAQGKVP